MHIILNLTKVFKPWGLSHEAQPRLCWVSVRKGYVLRRSDRHVRKSESTPRLEVFMDIRNKVMVLIF